MSAAVVEPPLAATSDDRGVVGLRAVGPAPAEESVESVAGALMGLAAHLAVTMCRWLLLVARFDELDGAASYGLPGTSRWLSHACGLAHRTAVEHVRVARALAAFPALAQAMGNGTLSFSQVRAISRVPAEGEHAVVDDLIEFARHASAAQLETVVRGLRSVERAAVADDGAADATVSGAEQSEPAQGRAEVVSSRWSDDSTWRLEARLDPERGALVDAALDALAAAQGVSRADALILLAEVGLATVNAGPNKAPHLRGDERAAVVVHVHLAEPSPTSPRPASPAATSATSRPGSSAATSTAAFWRGAHLHQGPGVPRNVVERLLCQGRVRTIAHGSDGSVLDVGRSRRVVSERQLRALMIDYDGTCAFPGCVRREGLEAHHVRHWVNGGRTDLANLTLLCPTHHHAHHDGEFHITGPRRRRRFVSAGGLDLVPGAEARRQASPPTGREPVPSHASSGRPVELAGSDRLDRSWAIAVLAGRRRPGS